MEFLITCNNGRKHLETQVRKDVREAVKFCNDYKAGDNFEIHALEKDDYIKGTRVPNGHIDWVKVPLIV